MAITTGAVILVTFWISMALPNLYISSAMILVEPQSVDEDLVNAGVRKSDLMDRLSLMTAEILSRARLSQIITEMDLYEDEHEDMQRFEVVDLMRSYVTVEPVMNEMDQSRRNRDFNFNTFRIVFSHENPRIAKEVSQRIANDFINANIDTRTEVTAKSLDFMQDEIDKAAYRHQLAVESGERAVIGVNTFEEDEASAIVVHPDFTSLERHQAGRVAQLREARNDQRVQSHLHDLSNVAASSVNLMPSIISAVKADATLGEISDTLREVWGTFDGGFTLDG